MADIRVSDVKQMTDTELDAWLAEHVMGYRWEFSSDPAASAQLRERMIHVVENFRRLEIHILQPGEGVAAQIAVGTSDVDENYPFCASAETECRTVAEVTFLCLSEKDK